MAWKTQVELGGISEFKDSKLISIYLCRWRHEEWMHSTALDEGCFPATNQTESVVATSIADIFVLKRPEEGSEHRCETWRGKKLHLSLQWFVGEEISLRRRLEEERTSLSKNARPQVFHTVGRDLEWIRRWDSPLAHEQNWSGSNEHEIDQTKNKQ